MGGGQDIWEVGNTERNNIEKNRENDQEDKMENKDWKEWTKIEEEQRRVWIGAKDS